MKRITLVNALGNITSTHLRCETTLGEIIAAAYVGGEDYSMPRYKHHIDGQPATWGSVVTKENNVISTAFNIPPTQ